MTSLPIVRPARLVEEEHANAGGLRPMLLADQWPQELLLFSGETRSELAEDIAAVQDFILAHPDEPIARLSLSLAIRHPLSQRLAVIATDLSDLKAKLSQAVEKLRHPSVGHFEIRGAVYFAASDSSPSQARVAFLFPGYGSYYPGMLADLGMHFPFIREWFDHLDEIFDETGGELPSRLVFPSSTGLTSDERQLMQHRLHDVQGGAQGGLTATLALHDLLERLGIRCDVMVGHSNGESAALVCSGTARFASRAELFKSIQRITAHYADSENQAPQGDLIGVSALNSDSLERLIKAAGSYRLHVAMDNCPRQVVLFGSAADVAAASVRLAEIGGICVRLPFDRAYHTPLYERQAAALRPVYETVDFGVGRIPLYSCVTAQRFPDHSAEIRELALKQWTNPVKFRQTIENLYHEGVRTFIEVGPNSVLTAFVDDTLRDRDYLALACNVPRRSGLEQLQRVLAQVYIGGMEFKPDVLFDFRKVEPLAHDFSRRRRVDQQQVARSPIPATSGPPALSVQDGANEIASAYHANDHLAILQGHFELMQQFLSSQSRLMSSVCAGLAAANRATEFTPTGDKPGGSNDRVDAAAWPLLGEIVNIDLQRFHSRRRFDVVNDLFLRDHTFGRKSPNWPPNLWPLPVMPFTISMEILAEAARYLLGGRKVVVGLSHLRGFRWLWVDGDSLVVDIEAQLQPSGEAGVWEVAVKLFQLVDEAKVDRRLAFEGTVKLADCYPALPPPMSLDLEQAMPATISAATLYCDLAFHGPCFQSVKRPIRFNSQGIEAVFRVTAKEGFFRRPGSPIFQIPSDLLDAASHLVYLWLIETGAGDSPIFPFYADRFQQYGAPLSCETEVLCRARIDSSDRTKIEASFDFLDQDEKIIARFEGLQLKQYRDAAIRKLLRPQTAKTFFSDSALESRPGLICRRTNLMTTGLLDESHGIWKRVLAHLLLSERERIDWARLPEKGTRRAQWLMGRACAKDAVREWSRSRFDLELSPVEIEITSDRLGRPLVGCPKLEALGSIPNVSISHSAGEAMSVAADAETRVGIDIECLAAHPSAEWVRKVLAIDELELANPADTAALLGLWCAKESASKAFGTGLAGKPRQWRVVEFSPENGTARVACGTQLFEIRLWRDVALVIAVCEAPAPAKAFPGVLVDLACRGVDIPYEEE